MKYIKKIIILAIVLIAVSIRYTYATNGTVTTDGVRVRKSPSTSADIVTVLNKSASVEILEETGEWYKIKYTWNGTYEGYMSKQFVKKQGEENVPVSTPTPTPVPSTEPVVEETPEIIQTQEPVQTEEPTDNTDNKSNDIQISLGDKVTNSDAKIYILPTVSASVKNTVKNNTTVTVEEIAGNFAYIKYNNQYGWIRVSVLQEITQTNPVDESKQIATSTNQKGYVNVTEAIVRKNASTSSEMVSSLKLNAEVTIIGEENDFYKIMLNGKEVYIAKRLISDTKQQTTNRSSTTRQNTTVVDKEEVIETKSTESETPKQEEPQNVQNTVTASAVGEQITQMAKSYVGYKYVYGGASPASGFDCSGLVYYICGQLGYKVNRTADNQVYNGVAVEKANLQPGDLVFFSNYQTYKGIGHVGIYIGNNQFVHASTATTGVIISSLNENSYIKRYVTARRIGA